MSDEALRWFGARVASKDFADVEVSYRVVGGLRNEPGAPPLPSPGERLTIEGGGASARLWSGDLLVGEARMEPEEVAAVFERIGASLPALVPRSEAGFVPDSVVGEITIAVAGDKQQLYFLIEPEPEQAEGEKATPDLALAEARGELRSRLREVVDLVRPATQQGVPSWP
jgi:hypothetical protein